MKTMLSNLFVVVIVAAAAVAMLSVRARAQSGHTSFVCRTDRLTAEERATLPDMLDRLIAKKPAVRELSNGYEMTFKPDVETFSIAAKWLEAEHRCCPCFGISVSVRPNDGATVVSLTGEDGIKEFIAGELPKIHKLTSGR